MNESDSNSKELNLLKLHIFFNNSYPFIYLILLHKSLGFGFHMASEFCKTWMETYINNGKDNGYNKNIMFNNNDKEKMANEHMIEIIENIKGNIYTNISLIIHVEGKIDLIYSNLHKEVIKELIPLNSNKSNILERLGFLFTFSN